MFVRSYTIFLRGLPPLKQLLSRNLRKPSSEKGYSTIHKSIDPIRILHLTDSHLFADSDANLRGTITHSSLKKVLNHIQHSDWSANLVTMTGDLIHDDSREAYNCFCELMRPLGLPVYCVPGNHDVRTIMQDVLTDPDFHYCESVIHRNWLIVGIDSCMNNDDAGRIDEQEMQRLGTILNETKIEHVLIYLHHPPLSIGSEWLDQFGLHNREEFLTLIARTGKVKVVIFGHVHQAFDRSHDSIRIIGTPSTCRQFKVASNEFTLDNHPPAYRRISLYPDGSVETDLIWLSD